MYLIAFPLLLIPFVLYNMIAFLLDMRFEERLFEIALLSGARPTVSIGTMLVILAILLLYIEIVKATRLAGKAVMDHVLSLVLLVAMVAEFMMVQEAGTATFLTLIAVSFVDVIGGFTVSIRASRNDIALDRSERLAAGG